MAKTQTKARRKPASDVKALLRVMLEQLDRDSERDRVIDMAQEFFSTNLGRIFTRHLLHATLVAASEAHREQKRFEFALRQVKKVKAGKAATGSPGSEPFQDSEFARKAGDPALRNLARLLLNRDPNDQEDDE